MGGNIQTRAKPGGIFYGWWIVVASFLIVLYTGGVVIYGFTAVFDPIATEFGWSHTQVSYAASLRGLEMGMASPITGFLVDRWGPRRIAVFGILIITLGLLLLSRVTSLLTFYGAFVLISIGMSCCTMTVLLTTIAHWFRRRVGLASGIIISGYGFAGLIVPLIVMLVDRFQWRMTMVILGCGAVLLLVPLALLLRHRPEQYGYLPDGDSTPESAKAVKEAADASMTSRQAILTSFFWYAAVVFWFHAWVSNAILIHVMPYLATIGISRGTAGLVASAVPIASIPARLGFGWLVDKRDFTKITVAALGMMGLGALFFGIAPTTPWLLVPFFILYGVGYGGLSALRPAVIRKLFGHSHFGAIYGIMEGVVMTGSFAGPPLAGWVYDTWGNYQMLWLVLAGLTIVPIMSILRAKRYSVARELKVRPV